MENEEIKITEPDEELSSIYIKTFDYDPTEAEVKKRYSAEFNEWLDNL